MPLPPPPADGKPEITELILLYNKNAAADPATPDELIAAAKNPAADARNQRLYNRLGNPKDARYLIHQRVEFPPQPPGPREEPPEVKLQQYLVLSFPSAAQATLTKGRLAQDPNILWVGENGFVEFSVTPSDPYVTPAASPLGYQWGLYALNMFPAWDIVRGHAYIGHIDSGIQINHPDLVGKYRPQFAYNAATPGASVDEYPFFRGAAGHGTHTAGIIAAETAYPNAQYGHPNPPARGVAGMCWSCTLIVTRVSPAGNNNLTETAIINGIYWTVNSGAQVLNMSFGQRNLNKNCPANPYDAYCQALQFATNRSVVIAAAAGNFKEDTILQFPANDSRTIAVGAIESTGVLWVENPPAPSGESGSTKGPGMDTRGVVAPGRDIYSTFYQNATWSSGLRCADYGSWSWWNDQVGYGNCTGTSMATPHITGLVGLMRSVNPLLSATDIRTRLLWASNNAYAPNQQIGYGLPNAYSAVTSVLSTTNRLTPLFAFYGNNVYDYFYTTVPQVALSAMSGTLPPYVTAFTPVNLYSNLGNTISGYPNFPNSGPARAQAWVFTTHRNPYNSSVELRPLYRLSYKCGDPVQGATVCSQYPYHVDHVYSTDYNEAKNYIVAGYKYDGIEGYVYPYGYAQPPGTELLIRAYKTSIDDHAIFPQSEQANMAGQGYTSYISYLGYVYRNNGYRPSY